VTLRLLSLGAGVQSTALALLSADGVLPKLDGAIFADTGWEPRAVYDHLDRLEREVLVPAGIPLHRVSRGNLREDIVNPEARYGSIPYFIRGRDGSDGMGRRQCTEVYKLAPLGRKVRELLGAAAPDFRRVPKGRGAEQWIGFSADEVHRISDVHGVSYVRKAYPLLDLAGAGGRAGWDRGDCERYLRSQGWTASRSRRASVARSMATGSGGRCATSGRRSGPTPWRSTRRSARAAPVACR